jgi:hypothetical protein
MTTNIFSILETKLEEEDPATVTAKKRRREQFTEEQLALARSYIDKEPGRMLLSVSDINVDMSYQTRFRQRIYDEIVECVHPGMLQTLKISKRPDGSFYAMDGATRVLALKERGDMNRKLHCEVWDTPGRDIEALMFYIFHDKASYEPMKIETRLQSLHVAGLDHGFIKAIEECGFSLIEGGRGKRIRGTTYMQQVWELDIGDAMRKALFSIKDAWRDSYNIDGFMVLGIARLYHVYHRALDEQMRKALRRLSPEQIEELVKKRWIKGGGKRLMHPVERPPLISLVLVDEINRHPGKAGKLDPDKLKEFDERQKR